MAKRKSKYTDEQRQARREADKALQAEAAELIADPDAVAEMAAKLATTCRSPKVLSYSLRNQALLVSQAEARGMVLTDVDSFRGWQERGRAVRKGEAGLRIVRPRGTESAENGEGSEEAQQEPNEPAEGAEDGEGETRTRFRMTAVFDISQTEGIEDAEVIGEAHEVTNPAAVLAERITAELERYEYVIEEDPACTRAEVDDGDLITVPVGRPVAELARALAVVLYANKHAVNPSSLQAA